MTVRLAMEWQQGMHLCRGMHLTGRLSQTVFRGAKRLLGPFLVGSAGSHGTETADCAPWLSWLTPARLECCKAVLIGHSSASPWPKQAFADAG